MDSDEKRQQLANDFQHIQAEIGFSGAALARFLDVHPNTVANWRNAKAPIPGPVWACLRLVKDMQKMARDMARLSAAPKS